MVSHGAREAHGFTHTGRSSRPTWQKHSVMGEGMEGEPERSGLRTREGPVRVGWSDLQAMTESIVSWIGVRENYYSLADKP